VITLGPVGRRPPPPVDRTSDRLVALGAIGGAVAFLLAAVASAFLPPEVRRGTWLPLHLALAGGATTAIAGVMPFFVAAFAAAPPTDTRLRAAAVLAVAFGALGVSIGVAGGLVGLALAGVIEFIGGLALTALAVVRPLGAALGPSRGLVTQGYIAALAEVAFGAMVASLFVAGWPPGLEDWGGLRAAHAWLNLVGFVSLTIGTTLLHFFPTVIGARIVVIPATRLTVAGLAAGPILAAAGLAFSVGAVAQLGAVAVVVGAVALALTAARAWESRGHWTTDAGWHRFAMGGLISAIAWFEVGAGIAAGRLFVFGASPAGWSLEAVAGPLVAGWLGFALLASATHLVPAVGPGDPVAHARQRATLGRVAGARLVVANLGVALLSAGLPLHIDGAVLGGLVLLAVALGATAVLLVEALRIGLASARAR
jgi:nitrite reductase (NO-forming)